MGKKVPKEIIALGKKCLCKKVSGEKSAQGKCPGKKRALEKSAWEKNSAEEKVPKEKKPVIKSDRGKKPGK